MLSGLAAAPLNPVKVTFSVIQLHTLPSFLLLRHAEVLSVSLRELEPYENVNLTDSMSSNRRQIVVTVRDEEEEEEDEDQIRLNSKISPTLLHSVFPVSCYL